MASKNKPETKNEEEKPVEPKTTSKFDWESELNSLDIPQYKKDGFRYYIYKNNINIKSKTEFTRKLNDYGKRNAGA